MSRAETHAVISCMRNEGPFLLEWVAYHRAIGFGAIYVVTNDCTDGTDKMLDRLEHLGLVTHVKNRIEAGTPPQISGMRIALALPQVKKTSWVLHIDADEFLNISTGDGNIGDLFPLYAQADCIALLWRPFGHNNIGYWQGGSVLQKFTMAQNRPRSRIAMHKSMFRPNRFGRAIDHMPKEPREEDVTLVNSAAEVMSPSSLFHPDMARYRCRPDELTWENACINHYAIRSQDVFLMKNDRGHGMEHLTNRYFLNSKFYRRFNTNEVEEVGILRKIEKTEAILAAMIDDAELRELHKRSLAIFQERRAEILTPEKILEWSLPGSG